MLRPLACVFAVCAVGSAFCQAPSVKAVRVTTPPVIDGTITDEEWKDVPSFEGLSDESTGQASPEGGKFWIAYDNDFIYFAARLNDSQPGSIRATEYRTNASLSSDDYVELDVDLTGSLSAFNTFAINPRGATNMQLAGGRAAKREWSGEFFARSRMTATGWETEARIPWQVMRIPAGGKRDVRFNVLRFLSRNQRRYWHGYFGAGQFQNTPRWLAVELPKQVHDNTLHLLPYFYAGYDPDKGHVANAGLDMKTELADQVAFVGTINPDFRNIENQILSIDFSRFERLAGETRPFFQEGRQYSNSALFASQRIRDFDAGINTYGRLNDKMSFAVVDTIDFGNTNSFVGNLTYDPNTNDSFRVTGTSFKTIGLENNAYLARYAKQMGPLNLFLRDMGSQDTLQGWGRNSNAFLSYSKDIVNSYLSYTHVTPNFLPRLGFFPERDLRGWDYGTALAKPYDHGKISELGISVDGTDYEHADGGAYRRSLRAAPYVALRNGFMLTTGASFDRFEGVDDRLYSVGASYPRGNQFRRIAVSYDWGRLAEEDYRSLSIGTAYRPVKQLQLTGTYQTVEHGGHSDQAILGMNYDLGGDRFITGRLVKRNEDLNAYVAYRRTGNLGAEYFLILGDPNADTFRASLILKAVFPLDLALGRKHRPSRSKDQPTILSQ
jgi:hypothetical protein